MFIILLGANPLVMRLATALGQMGHSLTCIAEDATYLRKISQRLDCRTVHGSPSYPDVLREADASRADLLIAATLNDEMNMIACQVAFSLFNIPMKLACINSAHYLIRHELFGDDNLPIDLFINPERLITEHIHGLIHHPDSTLFSTHNGITCLDVTIEDGAEHAHQTVSDIGHLSLHDPIQILAIQRDKNIHTSPEQKMTIQPGDRLLIVGSKPATEQCLKASHRRFKAHKRLLLASNDGVGEQLAQKLSTHYSVKIIEAELERCQQLAQNLPHCMVLHGDLNDETLMREENIDQIDVFCAITDDDEDNIIAAVQAKYLGARNTLVMMTHQSYTPLLGHEGIDIIVSPHQLILDKILSHCHHPWIEHYRHMPPFGDILTLQLPGTQTTWPLDIWQHIAGCTLAALSQDEHNQPLHEVARIQGHDALTYLVQDPKGLKALLKHLHKMEGQC